MNKILRKLFPKVVLKLRGFKLLILDKNSFLWEKGWMESVEQIRHLDSNGQPITWMNYSFVEFLTNRLQSNFNVFEYGS